MSMSVSRRFSHCVCWTAAVAVMYSASHVDNALIVCFAELQLMGAPLKRWTIPLIYLRSFASQAWSASECGTRPPGEVLACWEEMANLVKELSGLLGKCIPVACVARRYQATRLRISQCHFVDVILVQASLFVTKWILWDNSSPLWNG